MLAVLHAALKALRQGAATEQQWSVLAGCLDVALAIERQGIVRGLQLELQSAETALQAVYNRATSGPHWRAPTLHYQELAAVQEFVVLHAYQLHQLARAEYLKAVASALGAVQRTGGQAVLARDFVGMSA